jgi:rhomboid protease GluP
MLGRKREGSVVCPSCGSLVGVRDERCYMCGRANPSLWGFMPALKNLGADFGFVPLVIGTCSLMYVLTLIATGPDVMRRTGMSFMGPSGNVMYLFGMSGAGPLFQAGLWWTLLTAPWLHWGIIHIVFNMMSVRNLAPPTSDLIGPARTVIIYIVSGIAGFLLTSIVGEYFSILPILSGAGATAGASASICGLIGAITHYGRKSGSSLIRAQTQQWIISMAIYSFFPGIDSVAHLGGFLGGYGMSYFFNPLTRERGDHLIAAIALLGVTAVALAYGVWRALPLILG